MQCSAVQCSIVQCSTVQYIAVQCIAVQCITDEGSAVQSSALFFFIFYLPCSLVQYSTGSAVQSHRDKIEGGENSYFNNLYGQVGRRGEEKGNKMKNEEKNKK